MRRYFKTVDKDEKVADEALTERQREMGRQTGWCAWQGKLLYIVCKDVVERVMAYRRSIGVAENLSRKDLHDQMKGRPCFVPPAKGFAPNPVRGRRARDGR